MKIDELSIDHNALRLITECAQECFKPEECQKGIEYILGVIDMANAMKEVLKA